MAGSFGERLRREREMRGISLDNIAAATKIGTRLLRALEEEHFELLPGGIFNKGFVRAYAKYLGLNEDEAVADYLQAAGESGPDPRLIAEQNASRIDRGSDELGNSRPSRFPLIPVLILLAVIAAGWGGWKMYQDRQSARAGRNEAATAVGPSAGAKSDAAAPPAESASAANAPASQNQVAPPSSPAVSPSPTDSIASTATNPAVVASPEAKTSETTTTGAKTSKPATDATTLVGAGKVADTTKPATSIPSASTPATEGAGPAEAQAFEVSVRAKDRAWVSISSDGKISVRGIITPPDTKTVRATKQVVFRTGNAGAVEVSFNGQHIALAGGPNSEGVLVFNARGVVVPTPAVAPASAPQP
jgi:cytoskeleton protein RodZ